MTEAKNRLLFDLAGKRGYVAGMPILTDSRGVFARHIRHNAPSD
jgi:hypothetical protein